jgi:hypothetical protein
MVRTGASSSSSLLLSAIGGASAWPNALEEDPSPLLM